MTYRRSFCRAWRGEILWSLWLWPWMGFLQPHCHPNLTSNHWCTKPKNLIRYYALLLFSIHFIVHLLSVLVKKYLVNSLGADKKGQTEHALLELFFVCFKNGELCGWLTIFKKPNLSIDAISLFPYHYGSWGISRLVK